MPITSAARRASRASSSVQQPRAPVRYELGLRDRARWTPVTSCPASTALAAATAESTPPDIAASTRRVVIGSRIEVRSRLLGRPAGSFHDLADDSAESVDVRLLRGMPERKPKRGAGPRLIRAHREQHVTWLRDAGGARRPGRAGDALRIQQH